MHLHSANYNHVWACIYSNNIENVCLLRGKLIRMVFNNRRRKFLSYIFCLRGIMKSLNVNLYSSCHFVIRWRNRNIPKIFLFLKHCFNPSPQECRIYASLNWVSIGSGNGLSPARRQAIAWTNAHLLSIGPLGTNFSEILIKIWNFSFTKMHLKTSSAKRWLFFFHGHYIWQ